MSSSPNEEDCVDVKRVNDHAEEPLSNDLYKLSVISDKILCQDRDQTSLICDANQLSFNCEVVCKSQMSPIPSQECQRILPAKSFHTSENNSESSKDPSECLEDCEVPGDEESTESTTGPMEGTNVESPQRVLKKKSTTLDRSKLRKGKWTVEEEEYTSRIIHHFSTGLLTLPEGTTLRSYLAEKLNCDPMRITKKYAGASCLGKRVFHLCDQTQATTTDIQMAKAELNQLEHRFRLRVEHGQSGVPFPQPLVPSHTSAIPISYATFSANAAPPPSVSSVWLKPPSIQIHDTSQGSLQFTPILSPTFQVSAPAPWALVAPFTSSQLPQQSGTGNTTSSTLPPVIQTVNNEAMVNMAWAKAAVALTPALSQLAASNLQQHQQNLQKAFESQLQSFVKQEQRVMISQPYIPIQLVAAPSPGSFAAPISGQYLTPASLIQMSSSLPIPGQALAPAKTISLQADQDSKKLPNVVPIQPNPFPPVQPRKKDVTTNIVEQQRITPIRTKDDVDAGSMLMGFLNSLHQGFVEAKRRKEQEEGVLSEGTNNGASMTRTGTCEAQDTSSGSTSQPADSSPEDSQSEVGGGKDPSSSEESDVPLERSRVPPRKRHKGNKVSEFTQRNVAEHTTRMDALHQAGQSTD